MRSGDEPRPELPVRGTCFGYEVRSGLEWAYLRGGEGDPLEISAGAPPDPIPAAPLQEWEPPWSPSRVRLYRDGGGYRIWIEDGGWFAADPGRGRLLVPGDGDPVRREERALGLPMLLCFLDRGDLPLHAAAVEIEGTALILAAPRRAGKTTLAAGFAAAGHRVLSEDLVCVRHGPTPVVLPGPAMLRVRHDVTDGIEVPGAREVGRDDDRVHLALERHRGAGSPVPLGAIVLLDEADRSPRLEPVDGAEAVRNLWTVSFNLPTEPDRERCFRAVGSLASDVPVWRLERRLRLEDLAPAVDAVVSRAIRGS